MPRGWSIDPDKSPLLIGCGAVAIDFHLPRIQRIFGNPPIHLVEAGPARFEYLQDRYASNPRIVPHRSVPEGDFGLVLIATPPKFHLEYFEMLADRAEHILIEKPITIRVQDAEAIVRATAAKPVKVSVNHIRRLLVSYRILGDLYRTKHFGALSKVHLAEGGVFNWRAASMGSFSRELNGGGVLMDTGPHALDLLCQVFEDLRLDTAHMDAFSPKAIEANAVLRITADGRVPITVNLSRNRNLSNVARFEFEDAVVTVPVRDDRIDVEPKDGAKFCMFERPKPIAYPEFFDRFYKEVVLSGATKPVAPAEAIRSLRIIEDAYEHAQPMQRVFA